MTGRARAQQRTAGTASTPGAGTGRRVVVIGGGVAGLATACLLAKDGHDVVLLERTEEVGGRAGRWERDGFLFDTGPSWYLMPETFDHFYALMGTSTAEQLDLRTLDPAYRVYSPPQDGTRAEPVDVITGDEPARQLFERLEPGSGPRLARYLRSATRAYRASLEGFLYNRFARPGDLLNPQVLRALPAVLPLLPRSLAGFVAGRFRAPLIRQILGYPAVFLGASPYGAPALYHLMSHLDLRDGVRYPRGGFTRIVESLRALAEDHGVEIRTGSEAQAIRTRDGAVTGVAYRTGAGEAVEPADLVVSGVDLHHTETALLTPEERTHTEKHWDRQVSGPGAVLVMLGVRGALPELAHHTLFFTEDWKENFGAIFGRNPRVPDPASIYVCRPSATDDVAPAGHENLFVLVPVPADPGIGSGRIAERDDVSVASAGPAAASANREGTSADDAAESAVEQAADRAIEQISRWVGIPDLAERIVLRRTLGPADFERDFHAFRGSALGPSHVLRQSAFFRGSNASRKVAGLYFAGSTTLPGVGVPMCLISAELVLKAVRGVSGPGPLPEEAP